MPELTPEQQGQIQALVTDMANALDWSGWLTVYRDFREGRFTTTETPREGSSPIRREAS